MHNVLKFPLLHPAKIRQLEGLRGLSARPDEGCSAQQKFVELEALALALSGDPEACATGVDVELDGDRLVVRCNGYLLGVWIFSRGLYGWILPSYLLPSIHRSCVSDAVRDTIDGVNARRSGWALSGLPSAS